MAPNDQRQDRIAAELVLLAEGGRALDILVGVGPVVVIKGASLAELLWQPGERTMTDVDLLVRPDRLEDARRAMRAAGWTLLSTPGRPLGSRLHRAASAKSPTGVLVDVHAHVAQRVRWPVSFDEILARAVPFTLGRRPALRPALEDSVVIAALNEAKDDHWLAGSSLEDIARIVAHRDLDWDALIARARRWRATVALWVAFERACARFDARVPEQVRAALRPRRARALEIMFDLAARRPLRALASSRRFRQAVIGPMLTDSPTRFAASALGFLAVRATDAVASTIGVGERSGERAPGPIEPR